MSGEGDTITTRPMQDADLPGVIALLERTLGPAPGGVPRADLFTWKHLRGPFGRSVASVAEMEGEIVGLRSFLRWGFVADGDPIRAVRAVDTATSPAVQRRGLFSRLTAEGLEVCRDEGIAFVFNTPNDKSLPGYLKMGWHVVSVWPMRLKVRRPDRLLLAGLKRDLRSGAGVSAPEGSSLLPADSPEADAAFETASSWRVPTGRLHTVRTAAYLRWRYAGGPLAYHVMVADEAVVVLRLRARGDLREAVVCEALAAPGAARSLGGMLARIPREAGADHAVAHVGPGWPAADLLSGAGYRRMPRGGMTFTVRSLSGATPDPLRASSWSLTLGDLEVF
ncbi:MAG: hypothetical protein QOG88_200 [Actinomycetota bacterium]|nr:hypothetical protein [Actinomycetota bacterium]